jgi:hypothetical protein
MQNVRADRSESNEQSIHRGEVSAVSVSTASAVARDETGELLARHANEVRQAGRGCMEAIVETARRLSAAHREIKPKGRGHWGEFVKSYLKWSESTVRGFLAIGRLVARESADTVSVLPADTRSLIKLAGLEPAQLEKLITKHGGALTHVERDLLGREVDELKGRVDHGAQAASNQTPETQRARGPRRVCDPLRGIERVISAVSVQEIEVEKLKLLLEKIDALRRDVSGRIANDGRKSCAA